MTRDQINEVLERVRSWPHALQEDAVKLLLAMETWNQDPYQLSPDERADVQRGLEECARGEFASEEEVEALFKKYRG